MTTLVNESTHPPMYDFYEEYYRATATSAAHAALCERVYGRNFAQHGFADIEQLDFLIGVSGLGPGDRTLDLGCGNGAMAEYISDVTGAHVTGIDYSPEAIRQAQVRAERKADHLAFRVADMSALPFPPGSFDCIIAVDTLYFADLDHLLAQFRTLLSPSGQIVTYFAHGADPQTPIPVFRRETLPPDLTPLAEALERLRFDYTHWDFSTAEARHEARMRETLAELEPLFRAEGNLSLYQHRLDETNGVMAAIEAGCHARYLYLAQKSEM